MSEKIIVSACLLGKNCKYNGGNNLDAQVVTFVEGREVISVCPEVMAGMGIPRTPIEIRNGVVIDRDGNVVDEAIRAAVEKILAELRGQNIDCAVLKSRSPTCGVRQVYDGSFTGRLTEGDGILACRLKKDNIKIVTIE